MSTITDFLNDLDEDDIEDLDENGGTFDDLMHQKHIETLKFLKEVLNENKELRNRLNIIQAELSESVTDHQISAEYGLPLKTHLLVKKEDKEIQTDEVDDTEERIVELQKQWAIRKSEYENELQRVDEDNEKLKNEIDESNKVKQNLNDNVAMLTKNLTEVKRDNLELNQRIEVLIEENKEIPILLQIKQELIDKLDRRKDQLMENRSIIDNLNLRVNQLQEELVALEKSKDEEVGELKAATRNHENCHVIISDLEERLNFKCDEIEQSKYEINRLNQTIEFLYHDIQQLKDKLENQETSVTFKKFINMKRELNAIKQDKTNPFMNNSTPRVNEVSPANINCSIVEETRSNSITTPNTLPPLKESYIRKKMATPKTHKYS